jgi:Adenylyl/Guanylyl and SMODS C-terminal sensor domain
MSLELWQKIFGSGFVAPSTTGSTSALAVPTTEQWLERDFGIKPIPTNHTLRLSARTQRKKGFRHGELSAQGGRIAKGQKILFKVERCDVPEPYDVYWKVRNTGGEAARAGQLRGEIRKDTDGRTREESTRYRGSHWVECYIVKDGYCVASKKQLVFVK